jgi:hypothetical protein
LLLVVAVAQELLGAVAVQADLEQELLLPLLLVLLIQLLLEAGELVVLIVPEVHLLMVLLVLILYFLPLPQQVVGMVVAVLHRQ